MTQVIDKCPIIPLNCLKLLVISNKKPRGETIGGKGLILREWAGVGSRISVQDNVPI